MATTVHDLEANLDAILSDPNTNRTNYWNVLVKLFPDNAVADVLLQDYTQRAQITATSGTQVNFASTALARRPIRLAKDGRFAVIDSAITAVTISGGAGTQYLYADIGASAVTLVASATAPASETTRYRLPLGEVVWNGSVITALTSYAGEIAVNLQPPITQEHTNLVVQHDATTPDRKVSIAADALDIEGNRHTSVAVTADLTVSGANGLDTGVEAANTHYYAWVIRNPTTGTLAGLWSASATAPTLPSGYTGKRLVSFRRNDGASNLIRAKQSGNLWLGNLSAMSVASGITASADLDCSAFIPAAMASHVLFHLHVTGGGAASLWALDDKDDATIRYTQCRDNTEMDGWGVVNAAQLISAVELAGDRALNASVAGCRIRVL